jgi:hypothetical protein
MNSRRLAERIACRAPSQGPQHNGLARISQGLAALRDFNPTYRRIRSPCCARAASGHAAAAPANSAMKSRRFNRSNCICSP